MQPSAPVWIQWVGVARGRLLERIRVISQDLLGEISFGCFLIYLEATSSRLGFESSKRIQKTQWCTLVFRYGSHFTCPNKIFRLGFTETTEWLRVDSALAESRHPCQAVHTHLARGWASSLPW